MSGFISGRAHKYGSNIDTDQIYPGKYLDLTDHEDIKKHCLEGVDPGFYSGMQKGDIVVAGKNFGCGSSREHAVITLKAAGVGAVVAPSFARIFYRNAVNQGLPVVICGDAEALCEAGDILELDSQAGIIRNTSKHTEWECEKQSGYLREIIERGGIKGYLQTRGNL